MQQVVGVHSKWQLPDGAGVAARAVMGLRAFHAVTEDPGHVFAGPALNVSIDVEIYQRRAAELAKTEVGRELLRERPAVLRGPSDLAWLTALPEGSLGRELARYFHDGNITPFESSYPVRNDVEYLARRYRELHDVAHVLTGYGIDKLGELELQSFVLGNVGLRQTLLILALIPVLQPQGLPFPWVYAPRLRAAYERGTRSRDLVIAGRVERYWQMPLHEARRALGLAMS